MTTQRQQVITMNAAPVKPTGGGYTYPRPSANTVSSVTAAKRSGGDRGGKSVRPVIRTEKKAK